MESIQPAMPKQCSSGGRKCRLPIQFELSMKGKTKHKMFVFYLFIVVAPGFRLFNGSKMWEEKNYTHTQQIGANICWHFTRSTGESIVHAMLSSVLSFMSSLTLISLFFIPFHSIQSAMMLSQYEWHWVWCLSAFTIALALASILSYFIFGMQLLNDR